MLSRTLSLIQAEFEAKFNVTTAIRHKGEKGRQRENGLATLLREHLPMAYGVATGEIVPYTGDENSPQCDIIIYDQLHYPILFKSEAVQLVPLEAVYCVIETKTKLTQDELEDADNKFNKISSMPRCKSRSKLKKGMRREPLFVVFGYQLGTNEDAVRWQLGIAEEEYMAVALDTGIGFRMGENTFWIDSEKLDSSKYATLARFYSLLLNTMQNTDLGLPDFTRMIYG